MISPNLLQACTKHLLTAHEEMKSGNSCSLSHTVSSGCLEIVRGDISVFKIRYNFVLLGKEQRQIVNKRQIIKIQEEKTITVISRSKVTLKSIISIKFKVMIIYSLHSCHCR